MRLIQDENKLDEVQISISEFNALEENAKAETAWSGKFLADRVQGNLKVQLYSLDNFYVEVFYDPVENKIIGFEAFNSINQLAPYL